MFNNNYQKAQIIFDYVNGVDGAKAYQIPPYCKAMLMDMNSPMFFWKEYSTQTGQATITPYDFHLHEEPEQPKPITREEVEQMINNALSKNEVIE